MSDWFILKKIISVFVLKSYFYYFHLLYIPNLTDSAINTVFYYTKHVVSTQYILVK